MESKREVEFIPENQPDISDWKKYDCEAVDRVAKEFDGLLSAEKLEKMRGLPSEFKSREEFELAYLERNRVRPKSGVDGFTDPLKDTGKIEASDKAAQIRIDKPEYIIEQTVQHERLHQTSNPEAEKSIGRKGMEGVTQALTDRLIHGEKPVPHLYNADLNEVHYYKKETEMAKDLIAETGPKAVEKLYVQNDASELKKVLGGDAQYEARMEQFKKLDEEDLRNNQV